MPKKVQIFGLLSMVMWITACPLGKAPVVLKPTFNPVYGNGSCPMAAGNPDLMTCGYYKDMKDCLLDSCNATCDVPCKVKYCDKDGNFVSRDKGKPQQCVKGCNPGNANFPFDFGSTPVGLVYCPKEFDPELTSCSDYQARTGGGAKKLANFRGAVGGEQSLAIRVAPDKTDEQLDWMDDFINISDGGDLSDADFCSMPPTPTPDIPTPTPTSTATVTPTPVPPTATPTGSPSPTP